MVKDIPIKEIMTTVVKSVRPNDVMTIVSEIFKNNNFNHLPVIGEDNELVGMISRKDFNKILDSFSIFNLVEAEAQNQRLQRSLLVKDVMTKKVISLHPQDHISSAFEIFHENLIHALPIIDEDHQVVGIITTFDLLGYAFGKKKV